MCCRSWGVAVDAVWWVKAAVKVVPWRDGVLNRVSVLCKVIVPVAFLVAVDGGDGVLASVGVNVVFIVRVGSDVCVPMDVGECVGRREDV